jgi:hypothetical protein
VGEEAIASAGLQCQGKKMLGSICTVVIHFLFFDKPYQYMLIGYFGINYISFGQ